MIIRLACILALWSLAGCARPSNDQALIRAEFTRICMGVEARIVVFGPNFDSTRDAAAAAFDRVGEVEQALSDYRPDSEAMRLCAAPAQQPVRVNSDLFHALDVCSQVSAASRGAFDATVGPASRLWRAARTERRLPDEATLAAARRRVNWRDIRLNHGDRSVTLARADMQLDFGGVGKGLGAQAALDRLTELGFPRSMVSLGGDIAVGAPPPDRQGWTLRIDAEGIDPARSAVTLSHAAISTSGDAEQFVEIDRKRYSHIIDPRTGLGIGAQRSVTVIAPRGEFADSLATAAYILGPEAAQPLLSRFEPAGALFISRDEGEVTIRTLDPAGVFARAWSGARGSEPRACD